MEKQEKTDRIAKRKERVQEISEQMTGQGYTRHEILLDLKTANTISLLTAIPPIVIYVVLFGILVGWDRFAEVQFLPLMIAFFISLIVHEGIHALFFALAAEHHFTHIEFGIIWKSLNPYCYCGEVVSKGQYLVAVLMPGIILGGAVGILALVIGSATWLGFSLLSFLGAGGDFLVAWKLFRFPSKQKDVKTLDHPELPGVIVFEK